jgi:hypothetical protein
MIEQRECLRQLLLRIADLLARGQEWQRASRIGAAAKEDQSLEAFLISNDLWGGAGSIADEALLSDATLRAELEALLIQLGNSQLVAQCANPRTENWIHAFQSWQKLGLRPNQS